MESRYRISALWRLRLHLLATLKIHVVAAQFDFRAARFVAVSATQAFATKLQKCLRGNTNLKHTGF